MSNYLPFIKPNYVNRDGFTPLYVRYNYDRSKRTLIPTGFTIQPKHWDDKKKWIKRMTPNFGEIDPALRKLIAKLEEIVTYANENDIEPTVEFVHVELEKDCRYERRTRRVDMFEALDRYIEEKGNLYTGMKKDYKVLRRHLLNFKQYSSQSVSFRNVNLRFYNELVDYLFNHAKKRDGSVGLLTNSAGKVVQQFRAFINYQIARGVIPAIDLSHFKVFEEETDAIYLNELELEAIHGLDLSGDYELDRIRDVFIVGCFTGLRYSDLSTISPEHIDIEEGVIRIKQKKVNKSIVIPMIDYVPDIFMKYDYFLPKFSNATFNKRVKELGRLIGMNQRIEMVRKKGAFRMSYVYQKWEMISSHTCRRSFCTNMYLSGFPAEELMRISGHRTASAFMRYIKVDNMQSANRLKELRARLKKNEISKTETTTSYVVLP
jgi:integrase